MSFCLHTQASFEQWLASQSTSTRSWIKILGSDSHKPGRVLLIPSSATGDGDEVSLSEVAFCVGDEGGDDSPGSPFYLCSLHDQVRCVLSCFVWWPERVCPAVFFFFFIAKSFFCLSLCFAEIGGVY